MRALRWVGSALGALVLLLAIVAVAARLSDGPILIFPGGPLEAGELHTGPEPDWSFARDIEEMELQLVDPPRSRTVWLLVHEGDLYLLSGYMNTTIGRYWKQWPHEARRDPRAVIRIDGKRYERTLVRVHDPELVEALAAEARRKYGVSLGAEDAATGNAWFYRAAPREAPAGA